MKSVWKKKQSIPKEPEPVKKKESSTKMVLNPGVIEVTRCVSQPTNFWPSAKTRHMKNQVKRMKLLEEVFHAKTVKYNKKNKLN